MAIGLDPYVALLLHMNGADASVVFTDSSFSPKTGTAVGTAQIDTAQWKLGGSSGLFDGDSDYVSFLDHTDWNFGTGNLTIDFWVRWNALPGAAAGMSICSQRDDASNYWNLHLWNNGGSYEWRFESRGGSGNIDIQKASASVPTTGVWYHIALVRSTSTWYFFMNGVLCTSTATDADSVKNLAAVMTVGQFNAGQYLNGWLDELRISKGVARWTGPFTVPTKEYSNDPMPFTFGTFTPLRTTKPKLNVWTKKKFYSQILYAEVSPTSANTHGAFRIIIKDDARNEETNFGDFDTIWISGKFGILKGLVIKGIIERTMPIRYKGGQWALEISGRNYSVFAEHRKCLTTTTLTTKTIEQVIMDTIRPFFTEFTFNHVAVTGVTLSSYTILAGRSWWDVLKELAGAASTPGTVWGVYVCDGIHYGENGVPDLHFGPVKEEIGYSLIPISTMNTFDTLAPKDWRQIFTTTIVGYNNAGVMGYLTTNAKGPGILSTYSGNFNGTTAYATITAGSGDDLSFGNGENISLEAWIYPTNVGAGLRTILCKGRVAAATTCNYLLRLNATGIEFEYRNTGDTAYNTYRTTSPTLVVNTWYHVVVTYTMGTGSSIKVYVDGVLATGSWVTGTGNEVPSAPASVLYIGDRGAAVADFFAGYLDDLRICDSILTAKEVLERYKGIYMRGKQVFYMDFEGGSGNPNDVSGMGATGVATNMTYFAYNNLANSQASYNVIPQYFDRSWAGVAEAQVFSNTMLRIFRWPIRYVNSSIPLDNRFKASQYVYVTDKSWRGRAIIDSITHVFSDDPYSDLTFVYL